MGEFITIRNESVIDVSFTYTSLAKRYRQGKFYILNKDNPKEAFQIKNTGEQSASVKKIVLYEHSLLLVRLQCIVSKDLLNQKKIIFEGTTMDQTVSDERRTSTYSSDFTEDPTEYVDKTKYTFVISKYIEIKFEQS